MGPDKEKNLMDSELRSITNAASRMNFSCSKAYVNNIDLEKATFNKNTKVGTSNLGKPTTSNKPRTPFKFLSRKQPGENKCVLEATSVQLPTPKSFELPVRNSDENEHSATLSKNSIVAVGHTKEINSRRDGTSNLGRSFKFLSRKQSSGEKKCALEATSVQLPTPKSFNPSTLNFQEIEQRSALNENTDIAAATEINSRSVRTLNSSKTIISTTSRTHFKFIPVKHLSEEEKCAPEATSVPERKPTNFNSMHPSVIHYLRKNHFNFNDPRIPHDRILTFKNKMLYVVSKDLASVSGCFNQLFSASEPGSTVELPTVCKYHSFAAFLRLIYDDPFLTKSTSTSLGLLKLAMKASQMLEAPTIEKKCTDLLVSAVSPDNIDQMSKIAQSCKLGPLKVRVQRVVFDLMRPSANSWNLRFLIPMLSGLEAKTPRSSPAKRICKYLVVVFDSLLGDDFDKVQKIVIMKPDYLITKPDVVRVIKYGRLFDGIVLGKKVNRTEFNSFLQFIESGDSFDFSHVESVIKLGLLFGMKEIVDIGKKLLLSNLEKNFFIATKIAFLYDLTDLKEKIIKLVVGKAGNSTTLGNDARFVWNSEYFLANNQMFEALPKHLKKKIITSILGYPNLTKCVARV